MKPFSVGSNNKFKPRIHIVFSRKFSAKAHGCPYVCIFLETCAGIIHHTGMARFITDTKENGQKKPKLTRANLQLQFLGEFQIKRKNKIR